MENLDFNFRNFAESQSFMSDVKNTVLKIPKSHQHLVKGYKFKAEGGNTLSGDDGHVGEIDEKKKRIKVAAPWHYSRELTTLHEIAHAVWKYLMTKELKSEWKQIVKETKSQHKEEALNQPDEELFCMAYGAVYCKHPPVVYAHKTWAKFIKELPH